MTNYKVFFLNLGFSALVILGGIFYFNHRIDPHNRYHLNISKIQLQSLAHSDQYVLTLPENYDDRILLKRFILISASPKVAVIGGSRVMNLQLPEVYGFLNAGVTAGTLKDYIAVWQIMKQSRKIPRTVFLGVDPQSLNGSAQNDRWLSISGDYQSFFRLKKGLRDIAGSSTAELKDLLSLQTLIGSIKSFRQKNILPELIQKNLYFGKRPARNASFSMIYPNYYEQKSHQEIDALAMANGEGERKDFKNWNCINMESWDHLQLLLMDMQKEGVHVILILMPSHPLSLEAVAHDLNASENMHFFRSQLEKMSHALRIPYYDGFKDTESLAFKTDDFSDGVHLKAGANHAFFQRVSMLFDLHLND